MSDAEPELVVNSEKPVLGDVGHTAENNISRMMPPVNGRGKRSKWLTNYIQTKKFMDGYKSKTASISGMPATSKKVILPHDDIDNNQLLTEELFRHGIVNEELIHLTEISIPPNAANRQWAFDNSDIAQFITRMTAMTIIGDGILVSTDNKIIESELNFFLTYLRGPLDNYAVNDLVIDILEDSVTHKHHLSVLLDAPYQSLDDAFDLSIPETTTMASGMISDKKNEKSIILDDGETLSYSTTGRTLHVQKIDPRTFRKVKHQQNGAIKFVQTIYGPSTLTSKREFQSPKYNPTMITAGGISRIPDMVKIYTTQISAKKSMYIKMFNRPPIATMIDTVAHRKWLLWAMKKVGLKYAAPIPKVQVGNDDFFTDDLATRLLELQMVSDYLADMRFGDGLALDHNMTWIKDDVGSNVGFEFVKVIQYLERMIALAIGSSMSLFEASGAELATSRTVQDSFNRWIAGTRDKIAQIIQILCYKYLKTRGIAFKIGEFDIKWSILRERMMGEVVNAGVNLFNSGTITDLKEARSMFKGIFDLKEVEDENNKTYLELVEEKEYAAAAGRARAAIELLQAQNAENFKFAKQMAAAGLGGTSEGGSGGQQPAAKKTPGTAGKGENQQGSTTGNVQPGERKSGPQPDKGVQTASEREGQTTGHH